MRLFEIHNLQTDDELPSEFYHATYKPLLKKIMTQGLLRNTVRNYSDSRDDVVYLAYDPNVAESYAETSDEVDEAWLDKIIILRVDSRFLDRTKIAPDDNVLDSEDTVQYYGDISPEALSVVRG